MKLGIRILLSYLLVFAMGLYYLTHGILENIRSRYLEGVEDVLVDQARVLSSIVSYDMRNRSFSPEKLHSIFDETYRTTFLTQIYSLKKTNVDLRIYITDNNGILIYDSKNLDKKGTDYSQWRDVFLTLKGQYGARSSRDIESDPNSTSLYIASPILFEGDIIGVLTVVKPTTNINQFLKSAKKQIKKRSVIVSLLVVFSSILIMVYITKPIRLLTQYAHNIREGKKVVLPKLGGSEIGEMGHAFEKMCEALEGKKYVEKYVQTLTHEIKSPIAAIQGASELLEEDMPAPQRSRFLKNIQNESMRIERLVERMLKLSSIENIKTLKALKPVDFKTLVDLVAERMMPIISNKQLELINHLEEGIIVLGDPFLLRLLISNLMQNAVDFSPQGSQILLSYKIDHKKLIFSVEDEGSGIPDYALEKIFDKFFSLQRPDNGKKSTGLGLNFVREIVTLHKGDITLKNRAGQGVSATITIPLNSSQT